jgi:phosphoribosyl-AMP cyclohydrolase / phosphoribosyl-ATP pyrophosphohydrolase
MRDLDALDFTKGYGLVTVVTQDHLTGAVLMIAHADREALTRTLETGEMHYRSRTRGLWHKGATSGHVQRVVSLTADCDGDAVLARVRVAGPACHTGAVSCFERADGGASDAGSDARDGGAGAVAADAVARLDATIVARMAAPTAPGYTRRLLDDRNLRLKKLGEETGELIAACADGDAPRAAEETADLLYHALVALRAAGGSWDDVRRALDRRAVSAHEPPQQAVSSGVRRETPRPP